MIKTRILCVVLGLTAVVSGAREVFAQDPPDLFLEHLSDYQWIGPNGGTWQSAPNWTADIDPVPVEPSLSLGYPSDPNRADADEVDIVQVIGANFSKALASDLTVNITGGNVTVASIKLGGTGTAVTTSIASASNQLVFENQESNDNLTNPGNPEADPEVFPEPIWSFNQARALIWSTGTAGVGKQNRIDADVKLNDDVDVEGNRDLHIYGDLLEGDRMTAGGEPYRPTSISSLLSGGARLYIHGDVQVTAADEVPDDPEDPASDGTQERPLFLNAGRGIQVPADPQAPPTNPPTRQGVMDISGRFVGDGWINVGAAENVRLPLGSVILRADNVGANPMTPVFSGRIIMDRGNLVLAHNNVFGGADVLTGNPNTAVGFNIISDNDNRVIANDMDMTQWQTIRGATGIAGLEGIGDHSIEFSGRITQSNSRGFINLLPAGKELKISGPQYGLEEQDLDNLDHHRPYTIDGSGLTKITGGIHNRVPEQAEAGRTDFRKRGTGTVVIDYNEANATDTASDYQGYTYIEGGNLHFATPNDLPSPDTASGAEFISTSGAVGLDTGLFTAGGALEADGITFLGMMNNSANLNAPNSAAPASFLRLYGVRDVIFTRFDQGGLMLGADEYSQDLNFAGSQAANPLARAANMSLAAHEGGSTYTGTITPAEFANGSPQPGATNPTGIPVNPNTYRLGGGSGTLTLPNNNQLVDGTNTRHLLVANGGEVKLTGTHTYTGTTTILGRRETTNQFEAGRDDSEDDPTPDPTLGTLDDTTLLRNTTLSVTTLANGGVASSIGDSPSDASNLVVQGSTLKYIGGAVSTNRLFTVGTAGGTIDASGTGAVTFSSTAALAIDVAEDRKGYIVADLPNSENNEIIGVPGVLVPGVPQIVPLDTADLVPGMVIKNSANDFGNPLIVDDDSPLEITNVGQNILFMGEIDLEADNDSSTSPPAPWNGYGGAGEPALDVGTFQFGPAPARHVTLSGSNTGNNTLNPLVTDASDINRAGFDGAAGGKGSVGVIKSGAGKWILTGNNSYTGTTSVEVGTLVVNGNQTGNGTTTVSSGATLGGGGAVPGALISDGVVAPGATTTGNLTVKGNYQQNFGASLAIEIGGTGAGAFDSLTVVEGIDTGAIEGDYNGDFAVNAADYTIWRDHLGQTFQLANEGEDVSPGVVDQEDYQFWKDNFGDANISFGVASISGTINVDLISGFTPTIGNMFTIITANEGLTASNLTLTGESAGFNLIVNPTSLVLHYVGGGAGGLGGAAIPEPGTCVLLGIALAGVGMIRRRS